MLRLHTLTSMHLRKGFSSIIPSSISKCFSSAVIMDDFQSVSEISRKYNFFQDVEYVQDGR